MKKTRMFIGPFVLGIIFASLVGTVIAQLTDEQDERRQKLYEPLVYAIRKIDENYVTQVDYTKLCEGAYEGMLNKLDRFSEYIPPKRFKEFQVDTKGEFGGLGIRIRFFPIQKILRVESPIPGSPAAKKGILPGDRIIRIFDANAAEKTTDVSKLEDVFDAVKRLRGTPGTNVTITIAHEGDLKPRDVTITRAIIKIPGTRAERIVDEDAKIGYVYVAYFHENTVRDLGAALEKLKKQGMKALIIDLRFNPGGLLKSAIELSDMFLDKDETIVSTRGRRFQDVFRAKAGHDYPNLPIIVLVNQYSASASEIVAGAMKDNRRGLLVGQKTFGKGSVQTLIRLPNDDGALKLTTAYYYTPSGVCIHEKGIKPDVDVPLESEDTRKLVRYLSEETDFIKKPKKEEQKPELAPLDEEGQPKTETEQEKPFVDVQLERAVDIMKGILAFEALKK